MEKTVGDFFMLFRPLGMKERELVSHVKDYVDAAQLRDLISLLKQKKISASLMYLPISKDLFAQTEQCVIFKAETQDSEVHEYILEANQAIQKKFFKKQYASFAEHAPEILPKLIAPHIIGHDVIKHAVSIQLFASEPIHILLLGDPAIGKTDIIRSIADFHPISTYGLGSGMSGVGLAVTTIGDVIEPGLLPQADQGICCIDELNLLKEESRGALYNAMEKGFITYDKKGKHLKLDARVRVLATANPIGDKFIGKTVAELKKQIPFDDALLTRFHLVFLVRKPDTYQFMKITDAILKQKHDTGLTKTDLEFIKSYVFHAEQLKVTLPEVYHQDIVSFVGELKKKESKCLFEISPRLVVGLIRLVQARARMCLREKVKQEDIDAVKVIVERALKIT
ncbi:ATP-binding protein [Candidatus Woesearchaeota archaeon]|nr:ATP-binding protein [Candidatus Woesearchaeota archaeon]